MLIKTVFFFGLLFSINTFAQSNLYVASTEDWDFYFRPGVGGNHVWKNNDGTLNALVFSKGKGASFGEQAMYGVDANCKTKEFNLNNKGWKKPTSGSVTDLMLKKMCSYSPK